MDEEKVFQCVPRPNKYWPLLVFFHWYVFWVSLCNAVPPPCCIVMKSFWVPFLGQHLVIFRSVQLVCSGGEHLVVKFAVIAWEEHVIEEINTENDQKGSYAYFVFKITGLAPLCKRTLLHHRPKKRGIFASALLGKCEGRVCLRAFNQEGKWRGETDWVCSPCSLCWLVVGKVFFAKGTHVPAPELSGKDILYIYKNYSNSCCTINVQGLSKVEEIKRNFHGGK